MPDTVPSPSRDGEGDEEDESDEDEDAFGGSARVQGGEAVTP